MDLVRTVNLTFKNFGINKKREISRLVYEISKREHIPYRNILEGLAANPDYSIVKEALLKRRFPGSFSFGEKITPYLPKLDIRPGNALDVKKRFEISPKHIYIEEKAYGSWLANRLTGLFPMADISRIRSLKEHIKSSRGYTLADCNSRGENFFVINETYDFFKACPCTRSALSCGYNIFNLGFGCVFECTYCYLQEYTNCPGIILPSNIDDFFDKFDRYDMKGARIGTGEFTDSLALDHITQYSIPLTEFFNKRPKYTFEFKTKSDNISNLMKNQIKGNTVISWSLNPPKIIKENEFYSVSLEKRLKAARECVKAGYRVGFHFDPIIYYKDWEKDYQGLVNRLFDAIPYKHMACVSLGTFRFSPGLKPAIENRFPDNKILDGELLIGFDGKLRYPARVRIFMYERMMSWIRKRAPKNKIYTYLCMEEKPVLSSLKTSF